MRIRIFISTLLFFALSCKEKNIVVYEYPDIKDINEITTLLLNYDTIPIFKKPNIPDTIISENGRVLISYPVVIPVCYKLRKIRISEPDTSTVPPPPTFETITFENLYNIEINGKKIFNQKDSLFFYVQNDTLFNIELPKELQKNLQLTTIEEQNKKNRNNRYSAHFYDISFPIFSADLKTAYVEIRNMCNMCGGATAYILQKIDGRWKVTHSYGLWIS